MTDRLRRLLGSYRPEPDVEESEHESWSDEIERLKAETPPLPPFDPLPPLSGHDGPCPKCGSHALTIEFFAGQHGGCVDGRFADWLLGSYGFLPEPKHLVSYIRERERVPEHHDRRCVNCKYGWAEATAGEA